MPAIFFGHGNPMNAIQDNEFTAAWSALGASLKPTAVLCISAHWYVPGVAVTASTAPRTIHDFGGFPPELYAVHYPAPGSKQLAARVAELLAPQVVLTDETWGLDHGTWSVLIHVFPHADVPVVQLSIDDTMPPDFHYQLGRRLAPLREEGVLIAGSGNIVHNLEAFGWGRHRVEPYDWAVRFERRARELMLTGNIGPLIGYDALGADALLSVPTPEHYLPLLYVLGTRRPGEPLSFPVEGTDGGSISMLSVQVG